MKYIISALALAIMSCSTNPDQSSLKQNPVLMPSDTTHLPTVIAQVKGMYPVVITTNIKSTKEFYTKWFGYSIVFQSSWFILLSSPGENSSMIAFMDEIHPSTPPSPKAAKGDGLFLTIDVADSKALFDVLKKAKAEFAYGLREEPWGQRRFALKDPNGIWIDIVEQIQPKEGWWDEYMTE